LKILITGGCGFIGSHFCRLILQKTDFQIINLDALTYAGNLANCADFAKQKNYEFIHGSICDRKLVFKLVEKVQAIVNFAAETHVDNSIKNPTIFIETNIVGTQILLDAAHKFKLKKFVQISTDEVYGDTDFVETKKFTEASMLKPSSPYAASKAAGDLLALAMHRTFDLPVVISRCSNNFGTRQLTEKLIPLTITKILAQQKIPVYGTGQNVRDWIQVTDHCRAVLEILLKSPAGEIWNVGAENELKNLDIIQLLLKILKQKKNLIEFVTDRLGHDRRYALDTSKIHEKLNWQPRQINFEKELIKVVEFYKKAT
jgi:dTDP-glucose 4,6-dehydratase